jgi:Yip1 domain
MLRRIARILLHPKDEWIQTIAEPGDARRLLVPYVLALAAIGPVAVLLATAGIGESHVFLGQVSTYRAPALPSLVMALLSLAVLIGGWIAMALAVNLLAPTFGARQDNEAAFKLATYSLTPIWISSALALFHTLHAALMVVHVLGLVAGGLWSGYLLYTGLPIVLNAPEERALPYSIVALAATAAATGVALFVLRAVFGSMLLGSVLPG